MDFIWVPDTPSPGASQDGKSQPLPKEFVLFMCGFALLFISAFMGTGWMVEATAMHANKSMTGILAAAPIIGFMFQNIAAMIGTIRSTGSIKSRIIWFVVTQAFAIALLELSSLR